MKSAVLVAHVGQQLAPTRRSGDILALDNLVAHKVAGVRQAIESVGASPLGTMPDVGDRSALNNRSEKLDGFKTCQMASQHYRLTQSLTGENIANACAGNRTTPPLSVGLSGRDRAIVAPDRPILRGPLL